MRNGEYESVSKEETPAVDGATVRLALVVSTLSCSVSLCAIAFVVWSLHF